MNDSANVPILQQVVVMYTGTRDSILVGYHDLPAHFDTL